MGERDEDVMLVASPNKPCDGREGRTMWQPIACGVSAYLLLSKEGRERALRELGTKLGYAQTNRPDEYAYPPNQEAVDNPVRAACKELAMRDRRTWTEVHQIALDILLVAHIED